MSVKKRLEEEKREIESRPQEIKDFHAKRLADINNLLSLVEAVELLNDNWSTDSELAARLSVIRTALKVVTD